MKTLFLILASALLVLSCCEEKSTKEKHTTKIDSTNIKEDTTFEFKTFIITEEFCSNHNISNSFDSSYYGAFGNNYQRIDLIIDTIYKLENPKKYRLIGSIILKGKQVGYEGNLIITKVAQDNTDLYGMNSGSYMTNIKAEYELIEDTLDSGSGIFKGTFNLLIHENKHSQLDYNTLDWMQDGYSNYVFNGNWISKKGNKYITQFADGKLTIGDLNGGAGEFIPKKKYQENGWQSYMEQFK